MGILAGCGVSTDVATTVTASGRGTVAVGVTLDPAATSLTGGSGRLDESGLAGEGWVVHVSPMTSGGTAVTATHSFSQPAQVPFLLGEVVGRPAGFFLTVTRRDSSDGVVTAARGRVDLSCGVRCFGDSALGSIIGTPDGVPAGLTPAQARDDLLFSFSLRLPGRVTSSDATTSTGGALVWRVPLGTVRAVDASSFADGASGQPDAPRSLAAPSGSRIGGLGIAVGAAVIVVAVLVVFLVRRRRRPRGRHMAS